MSRIFYLIVLFSFSTPLFAWDCIQHTASFTADMPSKIVVQRDTTMVNVPITDWITTDGGGVKSLYSCDPAKSSGGTDFDIGEESNVQTIGSYTDNGHSYNIVPTNLKGVGVIIRARSSGTGTLSGYYNFPYGSWTHGIYYGNDGKKVEATAEVDIRFIATEKLGSGMITGMNLGDFYTLSKSSQAKYYLAPVTFSSTNLIIAACSITTGSQMSFPLGDVSMTEFKGIGPVTTKTSTVNLGLDCDADANINVTLSGNQNPDSSDTSVLKLTNQGQQGVAQGVGVQLLYNDLPLEINKMITLKKSSGGQESFAFTARYYQNNNSPKPGQANATATLNVTYQ
ncbi:fimbrial protein [Enterobacter quasiroggenkampii]|uniref:fimbrial protein n=1 Tax=Enterobacter quasiroggenkampii TaxID=2497436 RepID=UPI0021CFD6D2|nr:fimbrial protein [Enterobacter quasiroggenkampii]MCU6398537.1 fimbrial protein [Enterobacter quasiroggenkampii]